MWGVSDDQSKENCYKLVGGGGVRDSFPFKLLNTCFPPKSKYFGSIYDSPCLLK